MTTPQTTTTEGSLGRDVLYAARYYLGNRWTLVAVAGLTIALGLSFGGWGWLVAAGLAPILLATLPCLIMCGLGYCMMCRSGNTQSTVSQNTADSATPSAALGAASCCQDSHVEAQPPQVDQVQSAEEMRDAHDGAAVEAQIAQVNQADAIDERRQSHA